MAAFAFFESRLRVATRETFSPIRRGLAINGQEPSFPSSLDRTIERRVCHQQAAVQSATLTVASSAKAAGLACTETAVETVPLPRVIQNPPCRGKKLIKAGQRRTNRGCRSSTLILRTKTAFRKLCHAHEACPALFRRDGSNGAYGDAFPLFVV